MSTPVLTGVGQLGIVTGDLDRVIRTWADKYGVAPWSVYEFDPSNMNNLTVGGKPVEYAMRIALGWIGDMMLEVIEPTDDRSDYAHSLARHNGADHIHHILCATEGYEPALEEFGRRGVTVAQTGYMEETRAAFSYLDTGDDLGFGLELVKLEGELVMPEPVEVYPPPA